MKQEKGTPGIQDVNLTYISYSEDVQDVLSSVLCVLCPGGVLGHLASFISIAHLT